MAYNNNYGGGYQSRPNNGYGNNQQSGYNKTPYQAPPKKEFVLNVEIAKILITQRLDILEMIKNEAEGRGIKTEELMPNFAQWVTSLVIDMNKS